MKHPSNMNHRFAEIPHVSVPRSKFDRSFNKKTTFSSDQLIPIIVDEVLPGDTFSLNANLFARMATPIKPLMDNLHLDTFYFFVPNRLVWDNWEKFNGAQDNPGDSIDFLIPLCESDAGGFDEESIYDQFGIPTKVETNVSALPLRAYQLIWNEFFRDQNLQNTIAVAKGDGPDAESVYTIMTRGKRHDYFTSALPFPQKGANVEIPIGGFAPVIGTGNVLGLTDGQAAGEGLFISTNNASKMSGAFDLLGQPIGTVETGGTEFDTNRGIGVSIDPAKSGLQADLSSADAVTINQLREAFQIQQVLEIDARSGTRYTEFIKAHFGVTSPDFRLQRPEYLGGSSTRININPVQQTSGSVDNDPDQESPQGNLSAFATAVENRSGFTKSFVEHGHIIGLCNVRADLTYMQGKNKLWSRRTRYDYYLPSFAHLGEQAILNQELMCQGTAGGNDDGNVFGYQERWAEMRYKPSEITGKFRANATAPLTIWHLAQNFASLPTLGNDFIESNTDMDRVLAIPSEPDFLLDIWFEYKCVRPMPVYSVPGSLMSRF